MSCQQRSGRVALRAAVQTGIDTVTSKVGNILGTTAGNVGSGTTLATRLGQSIGIDVMDTARQKVERAATRWATAQDTLNEQVIGRAAPISNRVLRTVDRPTVMAARAAPYAAAALAALQFRGYLVTGSGGPPVAALAIAPRSRSEFGQNRQTLSRARGVVGTLGLVSTLSTSAIVKITKDNSSQRTLTLKQNEKVTAKVTFQTSKKVTRFLNRLDLIGSHRLGKGVISSEGDLVRAGQGDTWHRGTSVVRTANGSRTITHLQSLRLPAQHYYFDRKLSDQEVAGIVIGREKAHRMSGYAGEVNATENLVPSWGTIKKAMITTRLYHPSPEAVWSTAEKTT